MAPFYFLIMALFYFRYYPTHAMFKCKHTNRSKARSRSVARAEVSEGYWGSNMFSFYNIIASSLGTT